jgi:thiol-disulfide isomerase/thioredoxin
MPQASRGLQALALALVAALLGILIWRVVHREPSQVPVVIDSRKPIRSPAFEFPRLDRDGDLTLASLRGKAVVLNFWASWCAPCKEEIPTLQEAWQRHRRQGLVVVGVDIMDAAGDARSFARRTGITYPIVRDQKGTSLDRFSVISLPETLFVDRSGKIVGSRIAGGVHLEKNRGSFTRGIQQALAE